MSPVGVTPRASRTIDSGARDRERAALRQREARRAAGRYYTPRALAAWLARRGLAPWLEPGAADAAPRPPEILDPAMGDGELLAAAASLLAPRLGDRAARACLHGVELEPRAAAVARRRLGPGASRRLLRGDLLAERGPLAARRACFDLVIGNPPWGGWDRRLDAARRREYRSRFTLARGRLEPALLFIESATRLLRPGGRLALVLPDTLLLKNYPAARRHLLENYDLEELAHHGRVFPGVNLDAFTLIARRKGAAGEGGRPPSAVRCYPGGPSGPLLRIPQERFLRAPGHRFNLALTDADEALLDRIARRGALLGEWLEAHEGIHSGNIRGRLFIPPGAVRAGAPLLFGRGEIAPFRLSPAGWRVRYDRRIIRKERGEYASLGRPEWHRPPKLMIRRTGDRLVAALDTQGLFASNNLFVARARPGCPVPLRYVEAWLNTALATWCFRAIQPRAGRLFAELKLEHLARIPAPLPSGPGFLRRVLALAEATAAGEPGAREGLEAAFAEAAGLTRTEAERLRAAAPTPRDFL